jgi:uncharacterized protein YndB with AHSA1/START domain
MPRRIDTASRLICAGAPRVYDAFVSPESMLSWLPPEGMTGEILAFDFREGGGYRFRLTYDEPGATSGKTTEDSDIVDVRFVRLVENVCIEQDVSFGSEDPVFAGVMRMTWSFEPAEGGTLVTIRAEHVPVGIRPEDHDVGLKSSLKNLAAFVE